jgi:hypothetical protein
MKRCLLVGLFHVFRGKVPANEKLPPVFSCLIKQNRQDELLLIREGKLLRENLKFLWRNNAGSKMDLPISRRSEAFGSDTISTHYFCSNWLLGIVAGMLREANKIWPTHG